MVLVMNDENERERELRHLRVDNNSKSAGLEVMVALSAVMTGALIF